MHGIRWQGEALEELREIGRWYARNRPEAADRFFEDFRQTLRRVAEEPEAFPRLQGASLVRRARCGRYPYRIVFAVTATVVHVLAIAHDRRRPSYWRGRLRDV